MPDEDSWISTERMLLLTEAEDEADAEPVRARRSPAIIVALDEASKSTFDASPARLTCAEELTSTETPEARNATTVTLPEEEPSISTPRATRDAKFTEPEDDTSISTSPSAE